MIIENSEALKNWLISTLGTICDADPGALAKYVLALVKKDKEENELYDFCLDQLDVFLLKDTKYFVDLLFDALRTKSYLLHKSDSAHLINSKSSNTVSSAVKQDPLKEKIDLEKEKNSKSNSEKLMQKTSHKDAVANSASIISKETNTENHGEAQLPDEKYKKLSSSKLIKTRKHDERSQDMQTENAVDKSDKTLKKETITKFSHLNTSVNSHSSLHSQSSPSRGKTDEPAKTDSWKEKESAAKKKKEREELQKHKTNKADSDYKPTDMPHMYKNSSYLVNNNISGKTSKRCQDYDEKGYCMRGDLCEFDHGSDPVVVEDVSILNFGVSIANVASCDNIVNSLVPDPLVQSVCHSPLQPPPPSSPPPLPPPPPPLPPLPPSGLYVPEYNPEAPGMNITLPDHSPFWLPSNTGIHVPPPPLHNSTSAMPNIQIHLHNTKPHRSRELIGVPTVEVTSSTRKAEEMCSDKNTVKKFDFSRLGFPSDKLSRDTGPAMHSDLSSGVKRKGFDFNRLGPKPKKINLDSRCTLEVRKIPKHLNSISSLNNHFSKFGTVTNIQVCYENDPEAALIQFQKHVEAAAAYKSSEAVLNNRFIKVFWNNNGKDKCYDFKTEEPLVTPDSVSSVTEDNNDTQNTDFSGEKNITDKTVPEKAVTYSARGSLCRTVFNSAVLKKAEVVPVASSKPQKDDMKALNKKLELHKKKQELLENHIAAQRTILDKLSKNKNEKDKAYLKTTIKTLAAKITAMEADVKKSSEELMNSLKTFKVQSSTKTEAEKELLDAEMDLYNKQHRGDDTAELKAKVNELRMKAKSLGILPMSTPLLDIGPKPNQTEVPKPTSPFLRTDNRPRTLFVADSQNKEALQKHFEKFGEIENVEDNKMGIAICFNTRKAAEMALQNGKQFQGQSLDLSWLQDQHVASESMEEDTVDYDKDKNLHLLDADEDEDEEEDSEARSWRR